MGGQKTKMEKIVIENIKKQMEEKIEIGKVWGSGILRCDHCRTKKQCEKIIYNKFGQTIFICKECKSRC